MSSLTFNEVDLSTYGLIVKEADVPLFTEADAIQLYDKSYACDSKIPPKLISLPVVVAGTSVADLASKIDSIKTALNSLQDKQLILSAFSDRYWNARCERLSGVSRANVFQGTLDFICHDPHAYSVDEVVSNFNINADPKTIIETVEGSAMAEPVYKLTAGENLSDVTIILEHLDTEEEISWTGDLDNGHYIEIDVARWLLTKDGDADMATVEGIWPRLIVGENNIRITGFGSLGTLTITYRKRYL
jgi:predicted phage tail component-like protein